MVTAISVGSLAALFFGTVVNAILTGLWAAIALSSSDRPLLLVYSQAKWRGGEDASREVEGQ